jgi:hypothetical protein
MKIPTLSDRAGMIRMTTRFAVRVASLVMFTGGVSQPAVSTVTPAHTKNSQACAIFL